MGSFYQLVPFTREMDVSLRPDRLIYLFSESVLATFLIQLREICRASFESIWHARVLSNQIMFFQTILFPNGTVIAHIVNFAHVLCLHPIKDVHPKKDLKKLL